ncbi:MAG: hypothetical protein WC271_00425 [Bacteroidales bacterium]|jgi:hypothetical protein|nr:hypothetical protein [Bacteroidales bacterium]
MKKTAAILLVMLILSQGAGMFFLLKLQQSAARMNMKERLKKGVDDSELTHFVFHRNMPKTVSWVHEREFVYGGEMYDVVRQVSKGDSVFIACVHDHRETKLVKQLLKIVNPKKSDPVAAANNHFRPAYNWFCNDSSKPIDGRLFLVVLLPRTDPFSLITFQPSPAAPPPKV